MLAVKAVGSISHTTLKVLWRKTFFCAVEVFLYIILASAEELSPFG